MKWHILDTDGQAQPLSEAQITALVQKGIITRQTMLWAEGMADWQPAATARPELFAASRAPMSPPISPSRTARKPRKKKGSILGSILKIGLIVIGIGIVGNIAALMLVKSKTARSPGSEGLQKLEQSLSGAATRGSGETASEQKAATVMAETAESLRDMGISKGSGKAGRGLSGLARKAAAGLDADGFTAVCTIKGDTAVFLLHIPDLRKFTDEAKESMGAMAWFSACVAWQELPEPRPERLCVGLKGILSYDRVLEGRGMTVSLDEDLSVGTMGRGTQSTTKGQTECQQKLSAYFDPAK